MAQEAATYIGFHGTSKEAFASIKMTNFRVSNESNEWLGKGAYFFIEGISDPLAFAQGWAITNAWDNTSNSYRYDDFVVLKVEIALAEVLDLSTDQGLRIFHEFREEVRDEISNRFSTGRRSNSHEFDCAVCNLAKELMELEGVICNLYIKANKKLRLSGHYSDIPNSKVLVVTNPKANINLKSINAVIEDKISNHGTSS
ncbi:MAG: hypothetical protein AAGI24_14885 [Pseudomonadota bacterium]